MTKLLAQAIELLRQLPPDVQDSAARVLISQLEEEPEPGDLEAIKGGRQDFARGDFTTLDEWRHEMGPRRPHDGGEVARKSSRCPPAYAARPQD
jgi:hypothetical protein